ncbi:MAG: GNAT family N-acetyltransferase [Candidatus Bathyarchaeia archaeon]|jgi:GNAT superfamily N-acetyltransferase|nr:GNAT family N-acetyltransferase [Candidatus Bathyarchaeota archaeon A05DMB-4]MDH7595172.1 GNAT family N-acetyltransferase [Candidatus Bathyarchaeota archaeon]
MLKLVAVNRKNFKDMPKECKRCFYWQTMDKFTGKNLREEKEKKRLEWFIRMKLETGCSGGFIAYQDNTAVGFVQCAPAKYFPNVKEYPSGLPSEDAAFLACLYVPNKENQRKGVGTLILKTGIKQLRQQEFKAVETFARKTSPENPSGPLGFYLKNGFKIKSDDEDFPLVRLALE